MGMRVEISRSLVDRILAEAAEWPAREICGLLGGCGFRVDTVRACDNVAADPSTTFEIDPRVLFAAQRAARTGGPAVIGHYHSHPSGSAVPSKRDEEAAHGGEVWLILANGQARAWLARREGGFIEMTITFK